MQQQQTFRYARFRVALAHETDFTAWRDAARHLVLNHVPPDDVAWEVAPASADRSAPPELPPIPPGEELRVARDFVERAERVICHSDPERFGFLYRVLWRLRVTPELLKIASDVDVRRLEQMEKAVRRDIHKMRAFVRFRQVGHEGDALYVAWFEPEHFILERNAPFFVRRFTGMRWVILTPYASAAWDGENLSFGPGGSRAQAEAADETEQLWLTYFQSIFNPARLKVGAMLSEMPKKYWRNLPEAPLIPTLIQTAAKSASSMIASPPTLPPAYHAKVQARHWPATPDACDPDDQTEWQSLAELRRVALTCRNCPLWRDATQTVFGDGNAEARLMFVGEQPGDQEDLAGRPFVGPAGKLFDEILREAGVDRSRAYVTNAVKHFKFTPRGKRRIHAKPEAGEIAACRNWLEAELRLVRPELVVALGATAVRSLLGEAGPVTRLRGKVLERPDGVAVFVTVHPSFVLRIRDPSQAAAERARLRADLAAANALLTG